MALPIQAFLALALSAANKPGRKQYGKHLKQVYIVFPLDICFSIDKYTNNNADAKLFLYAASGQKEIPELFEKGHLVDQANNEKDKKLMLMQLPTMQRQIYI